MAVLCCKSTSPQLLLETLLGIEAQFGRVRRERWGIASTSILLYDDLILDIPNLVLPHPRMRERAFVHTPSRNCPRLGGASFRHCDRRTGSGCRLFRCAPDANRVNMTMTLGREPPQLLKQRLFYRGRKFDFEVNHLRLPNQAEGDWECIRHPGGALLSQRANSRSSCGESLCCSRADFRISGYCGAE